MKIILKMEKYLLLILLKLKRRNTVMLKIHTSAETDATGSCEKRIY
jgi:hypothetical protein